MLVTKILVIWKTRNITRNMKKIWARQVVISFNKHLYADERHQNLSEEEKDKKHQYCREYYKNLFEDKKQRLCEYRIHCYIMLEKWLQSCSMRFQFLAKRVVRNGAVLGQPDFWYSEKYNFPLLFFLI